MKQTAKKTASKKSIFWNAEKIGDNISGVFSGFTTGTFGLNLMIDKTPISLNKTQLYNVIKDNRNKLKENKTIIKIEYVSQSKVKNQSNLVKIYEVWFNGDEQFSEYIPIPASKKDISEFFE